MQFKGRDLLTHASCKDAELVNEFFISSRKASDDNIKNLLGQMDCEAAVAKVKAEWSRRDAVLDFCKQKRSEPKPAQDPSSSLMALSQHSRDKITFQNTQTDPRIDAYTARDEVQSKTEIDWIEQEVFTEEIIRDSTAKAVQSKCGLFNWE